MLEQKKHQHIQHINKMIKESKDLRKETELQIEEKISLNRKKLSRLNKMKQDIESKKDIENRQDVMKWVGTMKKSVEDSEGNMAEHGSYFFPVFHPSEASTVVGLGTICHEEMITHNDDCNSISALVTRRVVDASQIKCTGERSYYSFIVFIVFLENLCIIPHRSTLKFKVESSSN